MVARGESLVEVLGFRVQGSGFRVHVFTGLRVWGVGLRVQGLEDMGWNLRFGVQG